MLELEDTVQSKCLNTDELVWSKVVAPLEWIWDTFNVVWGIVEHLKDVKGTPELLSEFEEVQVSLCPSVSKFLPFYS